jgi:hypothetical protein
MRSHSEDLAALTTAETGTTRYAQPKRSCGEGSTLRARPIWMLVWGVAAMALPTCANTRGPQQFHPSEATMASHARPLRDVRTLKDFIACDGQVVRACGLYRAIPYPRGKAPNAPRDRARIELDGGGQVFVGGLGARPQAELARFDGHTVCVTGTAYAVMRHEQQTAMASSIEEITQIAESDVAGELKAL